MLAHVLFVYLAAHAAPARAEPIVVLEPLLLGRAAEKTNATAFAAKWVSAIASSTAYQPIAPSDPSAAGVPRVISLELDATDVMWTLEAKLLYVKDGVQRVDARVFEIVSGNEQEMFAALARTASHVAEQGTLVAAVEGGFASRIVSSTAKVRDCKGTPCIVVPVPVVFDKGSASIREAAAPTLSAVCDALKATAVNSPHYALQVLVHSDQGGSYTLNHLVSQKRAKVLFERLVACTDAPDAASFGGLGDMKPVADNSTPEGRAENSRIELVFVQPR